MSIAIPFSLRFERLDAVADSKSLAELRAADDRVLAEYAANGDYVAFEELVRRYRNDVYGLAVRYVRNREEAWDIAQEAFIKAHRGLRRFRGDASFKTWMLRITANQCKDYLKKRRLPTVAMEDLGGAEQTASRAARPDEALGASELGASIQAALEQLSHKHKTAFILREFEGLSYEEMAQAMNCSMGTVMSRLHHARKKLQHLLIQMGVVED
jgi:RNA polymerase sigma-70 factor (ECF subfamily)